jgi:hypothetical protein
VHQASRQKPEEADQNLVPARRRSAPEAGAEEVDSVHIVETAVNTSSFFDTYNPSSVLLDLRKFDAHPFGS